MIIYQLFKSFPKQTSQILTTYVDLFLCHCKLIIIKLTRSTRWGRHVTLSFNRLNDRIDQDNHLQMETIHTEELTGDTDHQRSAVFLPGQAFPERFKRGRKYQPGIWAAMGQL